MDGIQDAAVIMATEADKALLKEAGLLTAEAQAAGPNDLVIAVLTLGDNGAGQAALAKAEALLAQKVVTTTKPEKVPLADSVWALIDKYILQWLLQRLPPNSPPIWAALTYGGLGIFIFWLFIQDNGSGQLNNFAGLQSLIIHKVLAAYRASWVMQAFYCALIFIFAF